MKEKLLYIGWLCMYILCAGLGTITERTVPADVALTMLGVMCFLPGAALVADGLRAGNKKQLLRVRIVCVCSLALTLVMIVLNILCVGAGEEVGVILNDLLAILSAPMFCFYWRGISVFLWAFLLVSSFPRMWKK